MKKLFLLTFFIVATVFHAKAQNNLQDVSYNGGLRQSQFNKPRGYMGLVEIGGGRGVGTWGADRASFTMINGYRVIPQFAFGFGIGLEMFAYTRTDIAYARPEEELALPVFLHLRSDFIDGKVSPYFAFNVGYNVSLDNGLFDGLMLEPTLGVSFNIGHKNRMTAGVSIISNRVKYYYAYYPSYQPYLKTAMGAAVKLKIGFSF